MLHTKHFWKEKPGDAAKQRLLGRVGADQLAGKDRKPGAS